MLRILPTAAITARILVTARMIKSNPVHCCRTKSWQTLKNKKIKGRGNHHQNLCHLIQGILPLQKNQSRKVILLKATGFKLYLKLRVTKESFLMK